MYNYSGSGFMMFIVGVGFFIGLAVTLLIVYLIIRLVEQYLWPRGQAFRRPSGVAAPPQAAPATAAAPPTPPAAPSSASAATGPVSPAPAPESTEASAPAAPEAENAPGHEEGETTRAIRILDLRLANGEIEIDDYKSRRDALGRPETE